MGAELLESICDVCRRLHARNLLAAADGNVSALLEDGRIAITPSGVAKARLEPGQMAFMDRDGLVRFEPGPPARWSFVCPAGDGRTVQVEDVE